MTLPVKSMDVEEPKVAFHQEETRNNNASAGRRHPYLLVCSLVLLTLITVGLSCWIVYLCQRELKVPTEIKAGCKEVEIKAPTTTFPRFYENKNNGGRHYLAPPDWETSGCINLPKWANDMAMSVITGGHCLQVFEHENCPDSKSLQVAVKDRGVNDKFYPGNYGLNDLQSIGMDKRISSFRRC